MKGRSTRYSKDELDWIKDNANRPRREAHADFVARFDRPDVSHDNFKALCTRKGWKTGRSGRFVKGQVSHNKGKTGICAPGSEKGWFKKGARPHTYKGPGHESTDKDGYVWIIVAEKNPHTGADTRRVMKHKWLWEQTNGPVPNGHVLKCRDGDKSNTDPDNWDCIPRALLPRLNGRFGRDYDSAPAELKQIILATAKLEHETREQGRKR